jgi:hypothetical protein
VRRISARQLDLSAEAAEGRQRLDDIAAPHLWHGMISGTRFLAMA